MTVFILLHTATDWLSISEVCRGPRSGFTATCTFDANGDTDSATNVTMRAFLAANSDADQANVIDFGRHLPHNHVRTESGKRTQETT